MNQNNNNKQFLTPPKLSSKYINTVGAAGTAVKERYTTSLRITASDKDTLQPSFLFCKCCLVNLRARDVVCALGSILYCTEDGIKVTRQQPNIGQFVQMGQSQPHSSTNGTWCQLVRSLLSYNYYQQHTHWCLTHVSDTCGHVITTCLRNQLTNIARPGWAIQGKQILKIIDSERGSKVIC